MLSVIGGERGGKCAAEKRAPHEVRGLTLGAAIQVVPAIHVHPPYFVRGSYFAGSGIAG